VTGAGRPVQIQPLGEETFQRFQRLIYDRTRIHMRDSKNILVANRLRRRLLELGLSSYEEYYRYLTEGDNRERELPHFISAVSTNETYFYREINHFTALSEMILPELFSRQRRIRIWSAGCSTGEEPYTLGIILEEQRGVHWTGKVEILATDISPAVIQRAEEGLYGERSLRFVPEHVLARYFVPIDNGAYRVCDRLRRGIEFKVHNLLNDSPPQPGMDLIFCRNVMIYFDKPTQKRLVDEIFARVLSPHGYLCIGHSESLSGTSETFRYIRGLKAPVYQLHDDSRSA
jgi:chemotaxis protein methyltransferase CheR